MDELVNIDLVDCLTKGNSDINFEVLSQIKPNSHPKASKSTLTILVAKESSLRKYLASLDEHQRQWLSVICTSTEDEQIKIATEYGVDSIYNQNFLTLTGLQYIIGKYQSKFRELNVVDSKVELFKFTLDNMSEAAVIFSRDGTLLNANPCAQKLFGHYLKSPLENSPRHPVIWYQEDGSSMLSPEELPVARALNDDNIIKAKVYLSYNGLGQGVWLNVSCIGIKSESQVESCILLAHDITQEQQAQFQLKVQLESTNLHRSQLKSVLENINDGIICCNSEHELIFLNNKVNELLPPESIQFLLGADDSYRSNFIIYQETSPETPEQMPLLKALHTKQVIRQDYLFQRPDKQNKWLSLTAGPIVDQNAVTGAILAIKDITTEKLDAIEKEFLSDYLKKTNENLMETDSRRQKLLRILAHDLRSPLCSLNFALEDLQEQINDLDIEIDSVQMMKNNTDALIHLVDEVVDEAIGKESEEKRISLLDVANTVRRNLSLQLKAKNIKLSMNIQENLPKAKLNKTMMVLVLENLLTNAIKFSKENTEVKLSAHLEGAMIKIEIQDSGIGIPESLLKKIFSGDPSIQRQGTNQEKTTGFGLSFVHDVVGKMNGNIYCESLVGSYTKFTIYLPINGQKLEAA